MNRKKLVFMYGDFNFYCHNLFGNFPNTHKGNLAIPKPGDIVVLKGNSQIKDLKWTDLISTGLIVTCCYGYDSRVAIMPLRYLRILYNEAISNHKNHIIKDFVFHAKVRNQIIIAYPDALSLIARESQYTLEQIYPFSFKCYIPYDTLDFFSKYYKLINKIIETMDTFERVG